MKLPKLILKINPDVEFTFDQFKRLNEVAELNADISVLTELYKNYLKQLGETRAILLNEQKDFDAEQLWRFEQWEERQRYLQSRTRHAGGVGGVYKAPPPPPHILLEDGSDLLLEDSGLVLLELGTP